LYKANTISLAVFFIELDVFMFFKGVFQIAKLTGKGANLPSIALGEGGFLNNNLFRSPRGYLSKRSAGAALK
jgi:hypothetical protein